MNDKKVPAVVSPFERLMDGVISKVTLEQIATLEKVVELFPAGSPAAETATQNIALLKKQAAEECFNPEAFAEAQGLVIAASAPVVAAMDAAVAAAAAAYDAALFAASEARKESVAAAIAAANEAMLAGIGQKLPENLTRSFSLPNGLEFGPTGVSMPRAQTAPRAETRGRGRGNNTGLSEHQARIAGMYDCGLSSTEIADLVGGTNASAINQSLERACRKGWVPKRAFSRIDYI